MKRISFLSIDRFIGNGYSAVSVISPDIANHCVTGPQYFLEKKKRKTYKREKEFNVKFS